jgi:hypothetical protein
MPRDAPVMNRVLPLRLEVWLASVMFDSPDNALAIQIIAIDAYLTGLAACFL